MSDIGEMVKIAAQIEEKIKASEKGRELLEPRGIDAANAEGAYDKKLAITMMALSNGREFELGGELVQNPGVSITEKIARGICWEERVAMLKTKHLHQAVIKKLEAVQHEMTGHQSRNKHLSST